MVLLILLISLKSLKKNDLGMVVHACLPETEDQGL